MIERKGPGRQGTHVGGRGIQTGLQDWLILTVAAVHHTLRLVVAGFELPDPTLFFEVPQTDFSLGIPNAQISRFAAKGHTGRPGVCGVGRWLFCYHRSGITGRVGMAKCVQHGSRLGRQEHDIFAGLVVWVGCGSAVGTTRQDYDWCSGDSLVFVVVVGGGVVVEGYNKYGMIYR